MEGGCWQQADVLDSSWVWWKSGKQRRGSYRQLVIQPKLACLLWSKQREVSGQDALRCRVGNSTSSSRPCAFGTRPGTDLQWKQASDRQRRA
jgi:hypothetical protein